MSSFVEVDIEIIHETEDAYLVKDGRGKKEWLPKVFCRMDEDGFKVKERIAIERGLV